MRQTFLPDQPFSRHLRKTRKALGCACLVLAFGAGLRAAEPAPKKVKITAARIWELWPKVKVSPSDPYQLRGPDVQSALNDLRKKSKGALRVEFEGRSAEGRPLPLAQWGQGDLKILLWSQMHGDEPTATAALLDLLHFLVSQPKHKLVRQLQERLQLFFIPMLNPDGAERTRRRNAQGIDINRDALTLTTPEGRFLKEIRDRYRPEIGFNLHNQDRRTSAGETRKPVMISLLAVAYEPGGGNNLGRVRSKKICSLIYEALGPYCYGGMARYDDSFNVRAFGDRMSAWGTYTVLIESGWPGKGGEEFLVRVNFLALLKALQALADGSVQDANPAVYDALPENQGGLIFSRIFRGITVWNGNAAGPFTTDVGLNFNESFDGKKQRQERGAVADVGDLSVFAGEKEVAAGGWVVSPSDLKEGSPQGEIVPGARTLYFYRRKTPAAGVEFSNLEPAGRLLQGAWEESP